MTVVVLNEAVLALLRRRRVFHAPGGGERWRPGQRIGLLPITRIEPYSHVFLGAWLPAALGAFSYSHSELARHLRIGRYCSIGQGVAWMGGAHPADWASTSPFSYGAGPLQGVTTYLSERGLSPAERPFEGGGAVDLGNDVWIGDGAMIAPDVTIGDGAIVGARALVLHDVPPYAVVVGAPARVLRLRFPEPLCERLRASAWWRYGPDVLQDLPVEQPAAFLDRLDQRIADGAAQPLALEPLTHDEVVQAAMAGSGAR